MRPASAPGRRRATPRRATRGRPWSIGGSTVVAGRGGRPSLPFRRMGNQGLEHPSLLPSVLLGDVDGERRGRSTRDWLVDITAFCIAIVGGGLFFAETVSLDPSPAWI